MASTLLPTLTARDLAALHRSSVDGSLELLYQPEVDLATGGIVAMEGLLRWHHADLGLLTPPAFLDLAEDSGEIGAIGTWVLREGAAEAARWADLPGERRRLWLNVTAGQVTADGFVELVGDVVRDAGLPQGALGLDVGEHCLRLLGADAGPLLSDLRDAGVALAVDGFSSWLATLGAIAALPVDAVKLGHRYVRGVGEQVGPDGAGDAAVGSVIAEAHAKGMVVIAEGVETWGEAARLVELGCDRAHGWLYASAQRADKARWLLRTGTGWQGSGLPTPRRES